MPQRPENRQESKAEVTAALAERAERLWGPERAQAAQANITEAAGYVWLIAAHPPSGDEAPLFHPRP